MISGLDPELAAALASDMASAKSSAPPEGTSLQELPRAQASAMSMPFSKYYGERLPPETEYTVSDKSVPVKEGTITVRTIVPTGGKSGATYPVLVWFHGGGFMMGDLEMDDSHLRTISVELQLATVNVDYRLAPEHLFPVGHEDCYAALKWTVENASDLHVSLSKGLIIGGDSAGGNITAALALQARDDPFFVGKGITGQYLREPTVIHTDDHADTKYKDELKSFVENADAPLLNSERVVDVFKAYGASAKDLRISPLLAASFAGLPPAYIQVMEKDPLRDEGVVWEKALREAGVQTKIDKYIGVYHGAHYGYPSTAKAVKLDRDARDGLKWLLSLSQAA